MRAVYLDHAATTPTDPGVVAAMLPYFTEQYANPASAHRDAARSRDAVERARGQVAGLLGAHPDEIVFTSGGTESNNTVLRGVLDAARRGGRHMVTTAVEHKSVLRMCAWLEAHSGARLSCLPVDRHGLVSVEAVARALTPDTVLVSVMHANNEVGTLQPVDELAEITRARGVLLHTDAVQSAGLLPLDVERLKVDFLSLSAHKLYGPKGVGALYVRRGAPLAPLLHGGDQEGGRRASTLNVPGVVGLGLAAELARSRMDQTASHLAALQARLIHGITTHCPGARLNGHPTRRLPGNVSFSFPDADGELLLHHMDLAGVACATGSACDASQHEPSHVLRAMGLDEDAGTLRFSLGRSTQEADIDYVLQVLPGVVKKVRGLTEMLE